MNFVKFTVRRNGTTLMPPIVDIFEHYGHTFFFFYSLEVLDIVSKPNWSWNRMGTENSNFIVLYGEDLK